MWVFHGLISLWRSCGGKWLRLIVTTLRKLFFGRHGKSRRLMVHHCLPQVQRDFGVSRKIFICKEINSTIFWVPCMSAISWCKFLRKSSSLSALQVINVTWPDSNIFLNHIGRPSIYLPGCMAVWGIVSVLTGNVAHYCPLLFGWAILVQVRLPRKSCISLNSFCLSYHLGRYIGALLARFCIGFVEAAFFPGALFLLSRW